MFFVLRQQHWDSYNRQPSLEAVKDLSETKGANKYPSPLHVGLPASVRVIIYADDQDILLVRQQQDRDGTEQDGTGTGDKDKRQGRPI